MQSVPGGDPGDASPAATGPAGAWFEIRVGAHYLLSLLGHAEARGQPGVTTTLVRFQRGRDFPMDDIIVSGHDASGVPGTLEIQAKRSMSFAQADPEFADVVSRAVEVAAKPEFDQSRYEIAVAIARTTTYIERYYQEVLRWARQYQMPNEFHQRLATHGSSHEKMREFVATFRSHMRAAGAADRDSDVHRLLRRFQILAFDFDHPGSAYLHYARERCAYLLDPADRSSAGQLWDSLCSIAADVDSAGGSIDEPTLRTRLLSERGYRLVGSPGTTTSRSRVAEMATLALARIRTHVHEVRIDRSAVLAAVEASLNGSSRYLEIRGAGGVGKSAILHDLAQSVLRESRAVVLSPYRIPRGGWASFRAQIGYDGTAVQFLTDLAGDGGNTVFIDGLDRIEDREARETVADLLHSAAQVPGVRVVVTVRDDFDAEARAWLPTEAIAKLGENDPLVITELNDSEVDYLRRVDSTLAALLRTDSPAKGLVRNLYRLDRLVRNESLLQEGVYTEAQMARQWWESGDGPDAEGRIERRQILYKLAEQEAAGASGLVTTGLPTRAIEQLLNSGTLLSVGAVHVDYAHDVLRDWAVSCLLKDEPSRLGSLSSAGHRFVRAIELTGRLYAESAPNADGWLGFLNAVSSAGMPLSWRRVTLLALLRSEAASQILHRCQSTLFSDNGALLTELVRAAVATDSTPAAPAWEKLGIDVSALTDDVVLPRGPTWANLIVYTLNVFTEVPGVSVPTIADLYFRWMVATGSRDPAADVIVLVIYGWLCGAENAREQSYVVPDDSAAPSPVNFLPTTDQELRSLRRQFWMWCRLAPEQAVEYFTNALRRRHRDSIVRDLLSFSGSAPEAAPSAMVDLLLSTLVNESADQKYGRRRTRAFDLWDIESFPASPARSPYLNLLHAAPVEGLRLVRQLVAHEVHHHTAGHEPGENRIPLQLATGLRQFPWREAYTLSRGRQGAVAGSALMALEAWGHERADRGDALSDILDDVLGPDGSSTAFLLVAVDVLLSHWPSSRELTEPFLAAPNLVALDFERWRVDQLDPVRTFRGARPEPIGKWSLATLNDNLSRKLTLANVYERIGLFGPAEMRNRLSAALQLEATRLGSPDSTNATWARPAFAAMAAINRLDPGNYEYIGNNVDGHRMFQYRAPKLEVEIETAAGASAARAVVSTAIPLRLHAQFQQAIVDTAFLEEAISWAREGIESQFPDDADALEIAARARLMAATLVWRDGDATQIERHGAWALSVLLQADDIPSGENADQRDFLYNSLAIVAIGLLAVVRTNSTPEVVLKIFQIGARLGRTMSRVLRAEREANRGVEFALVRSLARIGFARSIYSLTSRHDDELFGTVDEMMARHEAREAARIAADAARIDDVIAAEMHWRAGDGSEPQWPDLPMPKPATRRRGIALGSVDSTPAPTTRTRPPSAMDEAGAAEWIEVVADQRHADQGTWLRTLIEHSWQWTAAANGVGANAADEPAEFVFSWNQAYFRALVQAIPSSDRRAVDTTLHRIVSVADSRFCEVCEPALRALDVAWFDEASIDDSAALHFRNVLAERLLTTRSWSFLKRRGRDNIERKLVGALAAMFMSSAAPLTPPHCYVPALKFSHAALALPLLTTLVEDVPSSTFAASLYLGVLNVRPDAQQIPLVVRAVRAWHLSPMAGSEFWVGAGIGDMVVAWLKASIHAARASNDPLDDVHVLEIVDILLRMGIPAAKHVQELIARPSR